MTNHPGDPRSNVLGEQPFDHGGWPQHTVTPTVAPPPPGNARNYVPYRGAEQHGVPNQRDPRADIEKPFASEQDALDRANDPTITPRDLVPVKPVPVTIVHRPDLLHRRRVHTATYLVRAGSPMLIAPADPLRTRLVITSAAAGDDDVRVYLAPSPDAIESVSFLLPIGDGLTTDVTDAIYAVPVLASGDLAAQDGTRIGVWIETTQSDGDPLL